MRSDTKKAEADQMFYAAEQAGLKLAIKGRIVTVVFFSTLMAVTRGAERAPDYVLGGLLFVALGLLPQRVQRPGGVFAGGPGNHDGDRGGQCVPSDCPVTSAIRSRAAWTKASLRLPCSIVANAKRLDSGANASTTS